ncbi:MAG: hypothetical protein Q8P27_00700, partial [Candidatus Peregrinibacteria bacterium]|nr:hypothetical protein [Candidatus Peregrinibacteria bacterium]
NMRAGFFRALLYYGLIEFMPTEGMSLDEARQQNEALIQGIQQQSGKEETMGFALVRGIAWIAEKSGRAPGAGKLGEVAALLQKVFEANRVMAKIVRTEVAEHEKLIRAANLGGTDGFAAAA